MALFYQPGLRDGALYLEPDESKHCIKVLRKKAGDPIDITDGLGTLYKAEITEPNHKKVGIRILSQENIAFLNGFHIHLIVAPTKNLDRIEWLVEKATEIGVHRISFVICKHSERRILKTDRLIKKAISAMKQSKKALLPQIDEALSFKDWMTQEIDENAQKFIAYVDSANPNHLKDLIQPKQSYQMFIGPEGDFDPEEITMAQAGGFQKVSLGPSVLRTETAALAATLTLNLYNQ
ncbi:16S rRNA (uracil(1498)-N(3))-methyltransferase [Persicobacter sp. CCB-QB2]|uniref:16S rRNA (uracil(1498)-N(3))-methyltransferase n=1 Tax=Persicobacter sp. CCB-QB2 TaxID=1561025 RepID=UPI0006A9F0D8|nr:16S rRNA (uracil(1498)-N(3))-methyltransferase [Persicobacter sp. CCB-QB2]